MEKVSYVYIMTNLRHTVLYTGVTSNLSKRIFEHPTKAVPGFTTKYNVNKLVYVEAYSNPEDAIAREKQIKAGSRQKKLNLINRDNPDWRDLAGSL